MIELLALSFLTRQLILVVICVLLGIMAIGFSFLLFLKIKAVRKENSVESLPTLVDLGLEELEESSNSPELEDDSSAFFDEEDDDFFQSDFLDKTS